MTKEDENKLWQTIKVVTVYGKWADRAKCKIKNCKKHQKYIVFLFQRTQLSDLFACVCAKHLALATDKALDWRNKYVKECIEKRKARELEAAKTLLNEQSKL